VSFLRQDFPNYWQEAFTHLFALFQNENADGQYKLKIIKFIIKVLLTFNQELVERDGKVSLDLMIANQVKDGIR
jgi:hypothetical protein